MSDNFETHTSLHNSFVNQARDIEQWERQNLAPEEFRRRGINRRIEDLQERSALTRGEEIELKELVKIKWSE